MSRFLLHHEKNTLLLGLLATTALIAGIIYRPSTYSNAEDSLNFGVAASVLKSSIHGDTNFVRPEEVKELMDVCAIGTIRR